MAACHQGRSRAGVLGARTSAGSKGGAYTQNSPSEEELIFKGLCCWPAGSLAQEQSRAEETGGCYCFRRRGDRLLLLPLERRPAGRRLLLLPRERREEGAAAAGFHGRGERRGRLLLASTGEETGGCWPAAASTGAERGGGGCCWLPRERREEGAAAAGFHGRGEETGGRGEETGGRGAEGEEIRRGERRATGRGEERGEEGEERRGAAAWRRARFGGLKTARFGASRASVLAPPAAVQEILFLVAYSTNRLTNRD
ncbi:uncharacterized protein LOC112902616 [Panicum hallii]|uniref:uncharacterized protein LOC112902616 n=1 Tax=Panicum hallii TaxID=206008 RepID=UPI000DF4DB5F|nr:uncharacterized protein LOC112902616 [Panicum hallii]